MLLGTYTCRKKCVCKLNSIPLFLHALTMLSVDWHSAPINRTHFVLTILCRLSDHCTQLLWNAHIFSQWEEVSPLPTHIWKLEVDQTVMHAPTRWERWWQTCLPPCLCLVQVSSCNFKEEQQQEGRGNQPRLPKEEGDEGSHSSG